MKKNKLRQFVYGLAVLISAYVFFGGDCGTDNNNNIPLPDPVAAPGSFTFKVEADAGSDSRVTFSWTASPDEGDDDFKGYRIITVEINAGGQITSVFEERAYNKTVKSHLIDPLERGTRFKSYLLSERNDGTRSDSLETEIYAGVFYNTDGTIDSYADNSSSMSGFGWNGETGEGSQYPYTQTNAANIDLHVRELGDDPYFFSPGGLTQGFKLTRMKNIGSGQPAFEETDLPEADETFLEINLGDVYLIKTQEEYYIKLRIKSITPPGGNQNYYTITFDYKLQPIQDLRIL